MTAEGAEISRDHRDQHSPLLLARRDGETHEPTRASWRHNEQVGSRAGKSLWGRVTLLRDPDYFKTLSLIQDNLGSVLHLSVCAHTHACATMQVCRNKRTHLWELVVSPPSRSQHTWSGLRRGAPPTEPSHWPRLTSVVNFDLFETGFHVTKDDLELLTFWSLLPGDWDCRHLPLTPTVF